MLYHNKTKLSKFESDSLDRFGVKVSPPTLKSLSTGVLDGRALFNFMKTALRWGYSSNTLRFSVVGELRNVSKGFLGTCGICRNYLFLWWRSVEVSWNCQQTCSAVFGLAVEALFLLLDRQNCRPIEVWTYISKEEKRKKFCN